MKILTWNTQGHNIEAVKDLIGKMGCPEIVIIEEMGCEAQGEDCIQVGSPSRGQLYSSWAYPASKAKNQRCTTGILVKVNSGEISSIHYGELGYKPEDSSASERPPMGLVFNDIVIVGLHAIAAENRAIRQIIALIDQITRYAGDRLWILGGDLNSSSQKLQEAIDQYYENSGIKVFCPDGFTHQGGNILDYFVVSPGVRVERIETVQEEFRNSDHIAVIMEIQENRQP